MVEQVLQLNREKTIFWSLVGILFLSVGLYIYFINATVRNVVFRQNLENKASALTLAIGGEEFQYISKKNAVTLSLAYSMGFKDATVKSFITSKPQEQVAFLSH